MSESASTPAFHYRARGDDGASVAGELRAASLPAALAQLQQRGLTVLELVPGALDGEDGLVVYPAAFGLVS